MRKTPIAALILGLGAAAWAQEGALPGAKDRAPRIAVIDMELVSAESLLGKEYAGKIDNLQNELKAEQTKKQAELAKLDAQLKALSDDLEKQQSVLSEEAADKKRQEIVKKQREREAFLEDGQRELQRLQARAQEQAGAFSSEFNVKIRPQVEAVVKERGIDLLFNKQVVPFANKDFDVSRDVIVKADDVVRAAKAKAPAEGAAAAPRPAAPKPQP